MTEAMQARVDNLQRELTRRRKAASLSTSERQAAFILRANRLLEAAIDADEDIAEDRDDTRDHGVWGDNDEERPERDGDVTSRRQAHAITRGRS